MVVATKKLYVTTNADTSTTNVKTITYNLPITQYTVNNNGSGSFTKPDGSIKFNEIDYKPMSFYLFSEATDVDGKSRTTQNTAAGMWNSFFQDIYITPSGASLSPNLPVLKTTAKTYETISHLLVLNAINGVNNMYFVIPVSFVSTNKSSDALDGLIIDISNNNTSGNYVNFNEILEDGNNFYYNTNANNTIAFCQDVYFSMYLTNPPVDVFNQQAKIAQAEIADSTGKLFDTGSAAIFLATTYNSTSIVLATTCETSGQGQSIYNSIMASASASTTFYINTLNLSIEANSDYDFIGCTIIDNGIDGKTPADTVSQAVVQTQTSAMLSMAVGVVLAIAAIVISPTIHQLIVTNIYREHLFYGSYLKVHSVGQSDYVYKTVPAGGAVVPGIITVGETTLFKHLGDLILTAFYIVFIIIFLGMGWSEANYVDGAISYSTQNKINYKITAILMIVLLFVIPAYIRMYYATNAPP
jgi:uncharacterized membrane protein